MKILLYIVTLLVLISCSDKANKTEFASEREFEEYINNPENGFIVIEESGELLFEARLMPPVKGEEETECTVNLRISRKDGGSVLDFGDVSKQEALMRESYLSFDLNNDVSIEMGGERYPPVFHHYERNYGLKPSVDILFNFMKLKPGHDAVFTYRDQLFGQGLVKIEFDKELFKNCYVAKK